MKFLYAILLGVYEKSAKNMKTISNNFIHRMQKTAPVI